MAQRLYKDTNDKHRVAAFVFDFICRTLSEMTAQTLLKYGEMPVLYAGGVMSNKRIRRQLEKNADTYFAAPEFSCDNAAGCALLCRDLIVDGKR
jgi:N6-L-threonylcarbamoyladenine synthase